MPLSKDRFASFHAVAACLAVFAMMQIALPATARQVAKVAAKASWTLMIYEDADNTLEKPELANVKEMLQAGSSEKVQVVMLCDRSAKSEPKDRYSDEAIGGLADWSGAKFLHVEKDKLTQIADWGDTNMADPATLKKFLEAAAKAYPADRYALIIGDHGSGWQAFCVDESSGEKSMNLRDLRSALEPFVKEHGKFDVVGLDACLMGSFETAQTLEPVAHFMIGSEELAPARGWNYDALIKFLISKPEANAFDLGRTIIDAYTIHFRESKDPMAQFESMGATLSLIELDKFSPLQSAVSNLADRCIDSMRKGHTGWAKVAKSRAVAEEYGITGTRDEGGEEEMHDLMHIAETLENSGEKPIADAAKGVDEAIRKTVRYASRGPCRPHSNGISIYFPTFGISLKDPTGADYLRNTFAKDARWINFLSLYSAAVTSFGGEVDLKPIKTSADVASQSKPVIVLSKCADPDVDKIHFVLQAHDGPDILQIGRLPSFKAPDGTMGQRFNGMWFHMVNKGMGFTCPITTFEPLDDKFDRYLAYVPTKIRHAGENDWMKAECIFLVSSGGGPPHGQLLYAFASTKQGPLQISLRAGDAIKPVYVRISADGDVTEWTGAEKSFLTITDPSDFSLKWGLIGKGAYRVGFEVTNYAGASAVQMGEVVLE